MKELIKNFDLQIDEAIAIGEAVKLKTNGDVDVKNIVACGLGGSGIGASFLKDSLQDTLEIPLEVVKSYFLPKYVGKNTLVIVASYSGNTEEAVNCFHEALKLGATIVAITSNGKVKVLCEENQIDLISIPGGLPPRACFAYSTVQLYYVLAHFGLIDQGFKAAFENASKLIKKDAKEIESASRILAEKLQDKIPVLYSSNHMESVTIRWRQQINENGKQLCWHHVVPEMNHNELVGWREKNENLAVVFLRNANDFPSIAKRMDLNKVVYNKYTPHIFEVWSKGSSFIERSIYLIHFGDWVSYYLSEFRGFDTTEVQVIDELKANLAK